MRSWKLTVTFLALSTVATAGSSAGSGVEADPREPVILSVAEKAWVLQSMRAHLAALQQITAGVGGGDLEGARRAAASMALSVALSDPARPSSLRARLPAAWIALVSTMHREFEGVGEGIQAHEDASHILARLGRVTSQCVACHASYRIEVQAPG